MTATNHVLTGLLIGLTVDQPLLAIVIAIASHFVLDALPHYGDNSHTKKRFLIVLVTDMAIASFILLTLVILRPFHWQLAFVCAVAAASPDLMWLPMWMRELKQASVKPHISAQNLRSETRHNGITPPLRYSILNKTARFYESPKTLNIFRSIKYFHKKIQWAEKTKNYPIEILWAASCLCILLFKVKNV